MPSALTYPGVYIEEIPSGVRTITGVATSITAFVGRALRGPTDLDPEAPVIVNSFSDYERTFGGLWQESDMSFAVRDFFLNGGSQAAIVRVVGGDKEPDGSYQKELYGQIEIAPLRLRAANPGKWASSLRVSLDPDVSAETAKARGFTKDNDPQKEGDPGKLFNLTVRDTSTGDSETFLAVTLAPKNNRNETPAVRLDLVLARESKLIRWSGEPPNGPDLPNIDDARKKLEALRGKQTAPVPDPDEIETAQKEYNKTLGKLKDPISVKEDGLKGAREKGDAAEITKAELELAKKIEDVSAAIKNDAPLDVAHLIGPGTQGKKAGLYALERADIFNLLSIPPYQIKGGDPDAYNQIVAQAAQYCEARRAFFIVDPPPGWKDKASAVKGSLELPSNSKNAAVFFPQLRQPNPFESGRLKSFALSGALAGVFARTDNTRGVWKAPAGLDATLVGVPELTVKLNDAENGELNQRGVNCLRAFPSAGRVVWGARTLRGADSLASEWKYIPVRRTALFIEESLYRGTQWIVFEPNDEPLWAQIRLNVGAFMHDLFRQGAFQGQTPREAYLVKCDKETTTQSDINRGIVNIVVGFAPLKPAEFVIIKLQQLAGQVET
jgi:uncharacterized protein